MGEISQPPGSVILRIRLGRRLRGLREAAGITAQQAARAIRGSESKISRIELGRHAAREIDVLDLLAFYGVTGPGERDELLALASQACMPTWWQGYADVLPPWFQMYLGLEEAAAEVLSYDSHFIPGLLQTDDYAAGLLRLDGLAAVQLTRLLAVRTERINRFAASGCRLGAVVDEAVLHRPVSSQLVLHDQLARLVQAIAPASGRDGPAVRIRPLAAGVPVSPVSFTIFRFADPESPDVVCTEQLTSASYLDRPTDVSRYAVAWDQLNASSAQARESAAIVGAAARALGRAAGPAD